jgi:outer membrane protein assembly factor BamB
MADHRKITTRWWRGIALASVAAAVVFAVLIAIAPQKQADQGTAPTVDPRILALPYINALPLEDGPTQVGVVTHEYARSFAGYNIFCSEDDDTLRVLDMAGREVHRIVVPDAKCLLLELYGDEFLLLGTGRLTRVGWNGEIVWQSSELYHHDVAVRSDGKIYALTAAIRKVPHNGVTLPVLDNDIVLLDEDGEVLKRQSLYEIIGHLVPLARLEHLAKNVEPAFFVNISWGTATDLIHANSLEIVPRDTSFAKKGQLLLSIRYLDRAIVVDFDTGELVWQWGVGQLEWPHDATLQDSDRVMIFDNGARRKFSRVVEIDPETGKIIWQYAASDFFTATRGSAQRLPGGNTLVTESDKARVFEVTPEGERVWEYLSDDLRTTKKGKPVRHRMYRMWRSNQLPLPPQRSGEAAAVP